MHDTVGRVVSVTVTLNLHEAEIPALSLALQVTTVAPKANRLPEAGEHETDASPFASLAVGLKVGLMYGTPPVGELLMLFGQVITGGVVSTTVTLMLHDDDKPYGSVALHDTVEVP